MTAMLHPHIKLDWIEDEQRSSRRIFDRTNSAETVKLNQCNLIDYLIVLNSDVWNINDFFVCCIIYF